MKKIASFIAFVLVLILCISTMVTPVFASVAIENEVIANVARIDAAVSVTYVPQVKAASGSPALITLEENRLGPKTNLTINKESADVGYRGVYNGWASPVGQPYSKISAAWATVVARFSGVVYWYNPVSLRDQFDCHVNFANNKFPWNLEPRRPVVSLAAMIAAQCNP